MKKITPYILIFFIFVNLFAPVSLELSDNKIAVNKNITEAASLGAQGTVIASTLPSIHQKNRDTARKECLESTVYLSYCFIPIWFIKNNLLYVSIYTFGVDTPGFDNYSLSITIINENDGTNFVPRKANESLEYAATKPYISTDVRSDENEFLDSIMIEEDNAVKGVNDQKYDGYIIELKNGIPDLVPNTPYKIAIDFEKKINATEYKGKDLVIFNGITLITNQASVGSGALTTNAGTDNTQDPSAMPACSMNPLSSKNGTFMGCVAQAIYYVLFQSTSYLFALSGTLFDNAFAYSVSDNSYRSKFVVEGWKVVRDFCNMFFIFILLYIAFGTILNLNGVKTKEMIINVVLIGIFINFSLFASQVIIDASNILARVFYNSNTITVKINDPSVGSNVIPLSAALVNKINPQEIILKASQINTVQDTRGKAGGATDTTVDADKLISTGTFILVTILATIVNGIGIFVFLSISIIFIARVIGLWIAMILVPFAFLSYTVPAMQDFEMVGWKKWWPETIKLAFLAPVFIFFLYLILQFIETGFMLVQNDAQPGGLNLMIGIILPFVFIMILLLKAKSVATTMSGKIGEAMAKAGATVGGLALGVATGGAALAMRGTIGAAGSAMKNSKWAQNMAGSDNKFASFIGNKSMDVGGKIGSKAFDVRNTSLGKKMAKGMGVESSIGKAAEGGFEGAKKRQIEKKQKRAKELEPGQSSKEKQDLNKAQEALKDLENKHNRDAEPQEAKVNIAQQNWSNANSALLADKDDPAKIAAEAAAKVNLDQEKAALFAIKNGGLDPSTGKYRTTNGNISQATIKGAADNLTTADKELISAGQVQTAAANALFTASTKMNTAINSEPQAQGDLAAAIIAANNAATIAALPGATTADAINHTNALSIQAAAQAKVDKITSEINTTTTAYNNADSAQKAANSKLLAAQNKYGLAFVADTDALNAQTLAMANGGVGESINEIKLGSLKNAQNAYDIKANSNKNNFANNTQYTGSNIMSKIYNYTVNGGVYSGSGADEAAHNIRMDVKTDK